MIRTVAAGARSLAEPRRVRYSIGRAMINQKS
jgi:hypothetical protein